MKKSAYVIPFELVLLALRQPKRFLDLVRRLTPAVRRMLIGTERVPVAAFEDNLLSRLLRNKDWGYWWHVFPFPRRIVTHPESFPLGRVGFPEGAFFLSKELDLARHGDIVAHELAHAWQIGMLSNLLSNPVGSLRWYLSGKKLIEDAIYATMRSRGVEPAIARQVARRTALLSMLHPHSYVRTIEEIMATPVYKAGTPAEIELYPLSQNPIIRRIARGATSGSEPANFLPEASSELLYRMKTAFPGSSRIGWEQIRSLEDTTLGERFLEELARRGARSRRDLEQLFYELKSYGRR